MEQIATWWKSIEPAYWAWHWKVHGPASKDLMDQILMVKSELSGMIPRSEGYPELMEAKKLLLKAWWAHACVDSAIRNLRDPERLKASGRWERTLAILLANEDHYAAHGIRLPDLKSV